MLEPSVLKEAHIAKAMGLMVITMLIAPLMDAFAKYLAIHFDMAPASITFARFTIQMTLLFCLIRFFPVRASLKSKAPMINIARGMIMGLASMLFFLAVKYMPLADAISIFFLEPLILMLMSAAFLGEEVGMRRKVAAVIGFMGALLVIQPSYELFGPLSLLPIAVAFMFSVYLILTRKYAVDDEPVTMQFYAGIGGVLALGTVLILGEAASSENFQFTLPQAPMAWFLIVMVGIIATVSHLMIVMAFAKAPASILAPFQYVEIISATAFGYLMFGDFPTGFKWVGIIIIISAGLYTFIRERQLEQQSD